MQVNLQWDHWRTFYFGWIHGQHPALRRRQLTLNLPQTVPVLTTARLILKPPRD